MTYWTRTPWKKNRLNPPPSPLGLEAIEIKGLCLGGGFRSELSTQPSPLASSVAERGEGLAKIDAATLPPDKLLILRGKAAINRDVGGGLLVEPSPLTILLILRVDMS